MEPIDLSHLELPGVTVKGELYDSLDRDFLVQDILEIEMPNGEIVDVGWYPEEDPTGSFRIRLYDYSTMHHLWEFRTTSAQQVVTIVTGLVLSRCTGIVSDATSDTLSGEDLVYA